MTMIVYEIVPAASPVVAENQFEKYADAVASVEFLAELYPNTAFKITTVKQ